MHHDHDVRAALEGLPVAGLLVPAVAEVLRMNEGADAKATRGPDGLVPARVIDENDLVHDLVGQLFIGLAEGALRVVGGQDDDQPSSMDHGGGLRMAWNGSGSRKRSLIVTQRRRDRAGTPSGSRPRPDGATPPRGRSTAKNRLRGARPTAYTGRP